MKLFTGGAPLIVLLSAGAAAAAEPDCPPGPMPSAIDSARALPPRSHVVSFAATPWEQPGRAWVVRLSRGGGSGATLEILRLLRQPQCNRYDVEKSWAAAIGPEEYRSVAQAAERSGLPPAGLFSSDDPGRGGEGLALDGTGLELRLATTGWSVTRTLNHYGKGGARLSATFRKLVAKHVGADELPAKDWRTRRAP